MKIYSSMWSVLKEDPEFERLCREYREEFGVAPWGEESLDDEAYANGCRILAVREDDDNGNGRLVGFAAVRPLPSHPHFKDACMVTMDAIFIEKASRKGGIGLKLIHEAKKAAREAFGATSIVMSAPFGSRLAKLLRVILGANPVSEVFVMPTGTN